MKTTRYTAEEITELTILADEARTIDAEMRVLMIEVGDFLESATGCRFIGWQAYFPELEPLDTATCADFRTAPFYKRLPEVNEYAYGKYIQYAADWKRMNNKCRREIAVVRRLFAEQQKEAEIAA